jgi:hypothetical protein
MEVKFAVGMKWRQRANEETRKVGVEGWGCRVRASWR